VIIIENKLINKSFKIMQSLKAYVYILLNR